MRKNKNLASTLGIQRENLGVTTHFPEILKLQFGEQRFTSLCILLFFRIIVASLSLKMHGYPQFSFWSTTALAKICFSHIVINRVKILWY